MTKSDRPRRVTVTDLALEAGVSIATVSYVLSGRKGVSISDPTRAKVLAAAEQLGYRRNGLAAALRTGRLNTIGVVCPVSVVPIHQLQLQTYISNAVLALTAAAVRRGMNPMLFFGEFASHMEPKDLADGRVDGVAVLSGSGLDAWVHSLVKTGLPCVEVGSAFGPYSVFPDHREGVRTAVKLLFDLGHRRFAYHAPWPDVTAAKERLAAFKSATAELGVSAEHSLFGPDVAELLHRKSRPTGLICFNDATAVAAIRVASSLGLKIPQDLSIVGFDDDLRAVSCTPTLTTIHNPLDEIAAQAIDMVLQLVQGETVEARRINVPTRLVLRESTGPPPALRSTRSS
jgi:LacI family transcriptional regulator